MEEYKLKMAVIAGASKALELRTKEGDDDEVIRKITEMIEEIVMKIDEEI